MILMAPTLPQNLEYVTLPTDTFLLVICFCLQLQLTWLSPSMFNSCFVPRFPYIWNAPNPPPPTHPKHFPSGNVKAIRAARTPWFQVLAFYALNQELPPGTGEERCRRNFPVVIRWVPVPVGYRFATHKKGNGCSPPQSWCPLGGVKKDWFTS